MGHVDHGKTSLLTSSLKNVIAGESGGITQQHWCLRSNLDNGQKLHLRYTWSRSVYCDARGAKLPILLLL
jgi:translation initiation factor IF-2